MHKQTPRIVATQQFDKSQTKTLNFCSNNNNRVLLTFYDKLYTFNVKCDKVYFNRFGFTASYV